MSVRSEKPQSFDKEKVSLTFSENYEFEKLLSYGSVRSPFESYSQASVNFESNSQHSIKTVSSGECYSSIRYAFECFSQAESQDCYNFESKSQHPFKTVSSGECFLGSIISHYQVSSQGCRLQMSEGEVGSLASIGFVTLDERSRQSSAADLVQSQVSTTSELTLRSLTGTFPGSTQSTLSSIQDVKVKRRNILREKLVKWNMIKDNQVAPLQDGTKVIDGETLIQVGNSKGLNYYYVENALLGEGTYGCVYKGYAIKGTKKTPVAVKIIEYSSVDEYFKDKDLGRVPGEVYFLKKMQDHPNVIKFLHYQRISPNKFVIICERLTHCKDIYDALRDKRGFFSEYEARKYVKTLVDVALTMERRNIVHRDLKLDNILYDFEKDEIKLIDFGMATKHKPGQLRQNFAGTVFNMPPEYILNGIYDPSHEAVRSIGIIIYQMLHGRLPYRNRSEVVSGLPKFDNASDDVKNLLTEVFAMDPHDRPSVKQVAKHPWLRRSLGKRVSSFVRGIFRTRRGSYRFRHTSANKSANHSTIQPRQLTQSASQQVNYGQADSNYHSTNNSQHINHSLVTIYSQITSQQVNHGQADSNDQSINNSLQHINHSLVTNYSQVTSEQVNHSQSSNGQSINNSLQHINHKLVTNL